MRGGKVVLRLVSGRGRSRKVANAEAPVPPGNSFVVPVADHRWNTATAYYVPEEGVADCLAPVPRAS